ncbi:MAG: hypothetical protein KGY60_09235 [Bacteroidales bacterium]|nr:hypothetical protein [Bacteroidales bacterium]
MPRTNNANQISRIDFGGKQNAQQSAKKAFGTNISNLYGHFRKQGQQDETSSAEKQE